MNRMAFRMGVVSIAVLLTGSALAQDDDQQAPASAGNAMQQLENGTGGDQSTGQTFDGAAADNQAPDGDDGSVVNPDGDYDGADAPDNDGGDQDDGEDSGNSDPSPTDPA